MFVKDSELYAFMKGNIELTSIKEEETTVKKPKQATEKPTQRKEANNV